MPSKELTELHQRIAELEQQNEQLQQEITRLHEELWLKEKAIASASNGISLADATQPDNPLIYVNPAFEQITGYSAEEVQGKNCRFLQGEDTDPAMLEEIRAAVREARPCHVVLLNYRKDGTPFWNGFSISPISNEEGELTHFVGIQTDITDQKQAELALLEGEKRLSGIISSAMDAIITVDAEQHIVLFNEAAERIFGYQADAMIGQSLEKLIPAHHRPKHQSYIQTFADTNTPTRFMADHRMVAAIRATGEQFPIEVSISQVDTGGQKLFTAIVRDVTERVQAEEERNRLQESIIQMQHALVQELSTPLIPITDHVVIMPLVGSVDSLRAQSVMQTLLDGVENNHARVAILDITGVPVVDTQVANTLIQAAQAVKLLGAEVLLTGIGPEIAQTLVGLGIDLSGITTHGSLQAGIQFAVRRERKRRR
jgi:PAS domain S-box-containing protein